MQKIFIIKEEIHKNLRPNWNKQNRVKLILIYIRQFYTTLLPQEGLEVLVKVIYAHFKDYLCHQNRDNCVTELLSITAIHISQKILSVYVFIKSI